MLRCLGGIKNFIKSTLVVLSVPNHLFSADSPTCNKKAFFSTSSIAHGEIEVFVNNRPVRIEQGAALIQACEVAGVTIPRFCYHERLSVAGNCRMCLVELEKSPKPVASCAMPAMPGMRIHTDTPLVHKAREGVMEFLLANHPLDCPICDQGGECDLQDQSVRYGSDRSRFSGFLQKRAVEDKDFGPLIKTEMTRCIHCTRCVRFANEIAGNQDLGTSGRGGDMQIGTYIEKPIISELSGNVIDLCPVGALTSKPYAFTARPWELKKTESVDVLDAVGSNIRIDSRGLEVMRVLPRLNEEVNQEWISDKTRFAYDGLKRQRLATPLLKQGSRFNPITWPEALERIADQLNRISPDRKVAVGGALADAESLTALKDFFNRMDVEQVILESGCSPAHGVDLRAGYVMNSQLHGVEEADVLLLVGSNPRVEAAVFNARIRQAYLRGMDIGVIGPMADLAYDAEHLGDDVKTLELLAKGEHSFAQRLKSAQRPMIVIGQDVAEKQGQVLQHLAALIQKVESLQQPGWNGVNILSRDAGRTAALDLGYGATSSLTSPPQFVYLLNADAADDTLFKDQPFVVYQGHHGDRGAALADVILPGAAYTEKSATYVNTEGRAQMTRAAVSPPGAAREDWKILRALSEVSGHTLPYDDVESLRQRMLEISPTLRSGGRPDISQLGDLAWKGWSAAVGSTGQSDGGKVNFAIQDFYQNDVISRASKTMAECSATFVNK